jgi:predicted phosphodiesterase
MRLAVFSDIHGNCVGLDAMLADLKTKAVDGLLCLGDAIQGGPQPAQVVARLRALGCPVVMGNADAWLLTGQLTGGDSDDDAAGRIRVAVRAWSLAQLSEADKAFIAGFAPTITTTLDGGFTLLAYHGSPTSFDDVIKADIPQERLAELLAGHAADAYCGGHTHTQFMRRTGAGPQVHFNPGSVGFAYSHHQEEEGFQADPWAEYAILEVVGQHFALTFRRVPYDVQVLREAYLSSGRPHADVAVAQYQGR